METPLTKDNFMRLLQENLRKDRRETKELNEYLSQQFEQLEQLTHTVSPDNFWESILRILGIDAKLTLMAELVGYDHDQLSIEEILKLVETDYRTYFKELCGDNLSTNTNYSMVFNVI